MESSFRIGLWERLGVAAFAAGVAGVAISVAYPFAYPESTVSIETWRLIFWTSTFVLAASVLFFICDLVLHILIRRGVKLGLALASIGTALIIVGAIVGLLGAFTMDKPAPAGGAPQLPDVTLKFVYTTRPAVMLINDSNKIAKEIKWTVVLWNLDNPRTFSNNPHGPDDHEPLPIPVAKFDFIRPHSKGGPQSILGAPISNYIKDGDHLVGSASVICPDCERGHTYFVSITIGSGGWFAEIDNMRDGDVAIPSRLTRQSVAEYTRSLEAIRPQDRTAISNP
jgi:hypothetical protein